VRKLSRSLFKAVPIFAVKGKFQQLRYLERADLQGGRDIVWMDMDNLVGATQPFKNRTHLSEARP
jgi:hypothetical protein